MSKKRAKRNTKAVLKKLRLKRHSGGHTASEKGAGGHKKQYNRPSDSYLYKGSDHTHRSLEEANVGRTDEEDPIDPIDPVIPVIPPSDSDRGTRDPVTMTGVAKDAPVRVDQTDILPSIDEATKKAVTDRAVQQTAIGQTDSSDIQKLKAGKGEEVPLVPPEEVVKMANKLREPDLRYDANKDGKITSGDALAYLKGEFTPEKVFKDVDNTEKLRSLGISTDSDVQKLGTATDATAGTVGSRDDTIVATRTAAQGTAASFPGLTDQQINDFRLEIRNSDEIQRLINEMAESADQVHNSPEYKEYLKRYGESRGKDVEAFEALKKAQEPLKVLSQEIEDLENKKLEEKVRTESGRAKTFEASKIAEEDIGTTTAAQADTTEEAEKRIQGEVTDAAQSQEAKDLIAAKADDQEVAKAKADKVTRPEDVDYAKASTIAKEYNIDLETIKDPAVAERTAKTLEEREKQDLLDIVTKEGVDLESIPEFILAKERKAQSGTAATQQIYNTLGEEPSVDLEGREAITGEAPKGDAAQIGGVPTMQHATRQAVTGKDRSIGSADMLKVVANVPDVITAAISEEPAKVEAQLDTDPDPKVIAAVAALPEEALVSVQMEKLLEGIEEGKTPIWARPAVAAVNRMMSQRGLSASTVGRDALFNAIIQTALPMAQSNAQALQQRANQNLSNQQQANVASAQQVMQVRMQNLANSQTAASQTAEMAQQIKIQQGQFAQQAILTSAQQTQQSELATFQAAQAKAQQESAQRQQSIVAGFDANARMDLANLQALNAAGSERLNAEQQARLTTYNARIARTIRQADLEQDMEKANLSSELRIELANLTEENAASRETMTVENQERLTNLKTLVDFKKVNVTLAQQMDLANLTNQQQMELANLSEKAATDTANMTVANKMKLQQLTIYTTMMAKNEDLRLKAELGQLSAAEKVELANLVYLNQEDKDSFTAKNNASLQGFQARMRAGEVNQKLAQQLGLANLSNEQSAAMFNAQINAQLDMTQFNFEQQTELANSKFMQGLVMTEMSNEQQLTIQNATTLATMDLQNANARTRVSVENAKSFLSRDMADLNNRQQAIMLDRQQQQQALLSNQAAENAAKQFGATSQNQIDQFLISQANSMEQFNANAKNAMAQFNATEKNRMAALDAGNQLQADTLQAQLDSDISKFNAQIDDQRDRWNAANAQAVEQSNINWRRQSNTIDTAAQNAANQQNAQNSYNLTALEQSQLWQQLRDEAAYIRVAYESEQQRITQLYATAIGNESGKYGTTGASLNWIKNLV